jgi:RNA polymerase sigma-70 factor (ECF subfamily)
VQHRLAALRAQVEPTGSQWPVFPGHALLGREREGNCRHLQAELRCRRFDGETADDIANRVKSGEHGTFGKLSCINGWRRNSLENGEPQLVEIEYRELVSRVLAGRTDDFRELVERHQQSIFRFTLGLLGNREEAEDVTQEAFLAAFANLSGYDSSRATFSTWLFTIARNRCINLLKHSRPMALNELDSIADVTPTDPIVSQELSQQLDRALATLPVEQRSAFALAEIEELPYAEIARIERTSIGTVKSRIHRAKQRLQSLLDPIMRESK